MYAVIRTGGKQYKVAEKQTLVVEKLAGAAGDAVSFDSVLMIGDGEETTVGTPYVAGATVTAEVVEQSRAAKIVVFKKKRRKNYRRHKGHRQEQTVLRITEILTGGKALAQAAPAAEEPAPEAETPEAETAAPEAEAAAPETAMPETATVKAESAPAEEGPAEEDAAEEDAAAAAKKIEE